MHLLKLARFLDGSTPKLGIISGSSTKIMDLSKVMSDVPLSSQDFFSRWPGILTPIYEGLKSERFFLDIDQVKLLSAASTCKRIFGVGYNYPVEGDQKKQLFFEKSPAAIQNPGEPVYLSKSSRNVILEGELVIVIGKQGKYIKAEDYAKYVAGYTICNDVTDLAFLAEGEGSIILGKSQDTFLPLGPYILLNELSKDPIDVSSYTLQSKINGKVVQNVKFGEMILKVPQMVEYLSNFITLYPGDLILTGTPNSADTASRGYHQIKVGDVMEICSEDFGSLINPVLMEPDQYE